jgi:tetratricopeptide (TPR) repeat protein
MASDNREKGFPRTLGPFELRGLLGRGGMGSVYRAHDPQSGREVALKVLEQSEGWEAAGDDMARRFDLEARAAGSLRHPNLVGVHSQGAEPGRLWLAMELVEGRSLSSVLSEDGPLGPARAARIVRDLADGVGHAHSREILHRDIKPANVILTPEGVPRLTDFGLARELRASAEALTRAGSILGTPGYLSPEQANGSAVDERADVYGLGACLFALLSGRPPFLGESVVETLRMVLLDPADPPSSSAEGIPPELDRICMRCLQKEPDLRYASAVEVRDDLQRFLEGQGLAQVPRRLGGSLRRRWRVLWLGGLLALGVGALLVGLYFAALSQRRSELGAQAKAWREDVGRERWVGVPPPREVAMARAELGHLGGLDELLPHLRAIEGLGYLLAGERGAAQACAAAGGDALDEERLLAAALAATDATTDAAGLRRVEVWLRPFSGPEPRRWRALALARLFLQVSDPRRAPLRAATPLWASDVEDPLVRRARTCAGLRLVRAGRLALREVRSTLPSSAPLSDAWMLECALLHIQANEIPDLLVCLDPRRPPGQDLAVGAATRIRAELGRLGADLSGSGWARVSQAALTRADELLSQAKGRVGSFLRKERGQPLPVGRQGIEALRLAALVHAPTADRLVDHCQRLGVFLRLPEAAVAAARREESAASGRLLPTELDDICAQYFGLTEAAPENVQLAKILTELTLFLHKAPEAARRFLPFFAHARLLLKGEDRRAAALREARFVLITSRSVPGEEREPFGRRTLKLVEEEGLLEPGRPTRQQALLVAGRASMLVADYERALQHVSAALQGHERDPDILQTRALIYFSLNRFREAMRDTRAAGEICAESDNLPLLRRIARHAWNGRAWKSVDSADVRRVLELAADRDPRNPIWQVLVGAYLLTQEEEQAGKERLRAALARGDLKPRRLEPLIRRLLGAPRSRDQALKELDGIIEGRDYLR